MHISYSSTSRFAIIALTIILLCDTCICQTRNRQSDNRQQNRRRNNKKDTTDPNQKRINCYSCYVDFAKEGFDNTNLCYNSRYNTTQADLEILTLCPLTTVVCLIDITRRNGVLEIIDRRCGEPYKRCHDGICISKGYGVLKETCTYCCGGKVTKNDANYDENTSKKYWCPNEKHWGAY